MVVIQEGRYFAFGDSMPYFTIERDGVFVTSIDEEWLVFEWIEKNVPLDEGVQVRYI